MKIYVVRHGETNVNLENRVNALNDDDLNETGIKQAKLLNIKFKDINYDLIICSPLARSKHTARLLNSKNIQIMYDERIVERDAGVITKELMSNINLDEWWNINPKIKYTNAETVTNVLERVKSFLEEIKVKYSNKTIVLVTHGGVSMAIECYFNGIPSNGNLETYKHLNGEIKEFDL